MKVALGHQARVGKDEFIDYMKKLLGPDAKIYIIRLAEPVYDISKNIQQILGKPIEKNPVLLQFIGEGLRNIYTKDVWIDLACSKIEEIMRNEPTSHIFIPDMRYPNEMTELKRLGFTTVKIIRENRPIDRDPNHISETALSSAKFDHIINNNQNLEQYHSQIDSLSRML